MDFLKMSRDRIFDPCIRDVAFVFANTYSHGTGGATHIEASAWAKNAVDHIVRDQRDKCVPRGCLLCGRCLHYGKAEISVSALQEHNLPFSQNGDLPCLYRQIAICLCPERSLGPSEYPVCRTRCVQSQRERVNSGAWSRPRPGILGSHTGM